MSAPEEETPYNGVVLQNTDPILVHRQPNTPTRLRGGSCSLKEDGNGNVYNFLYK